MTRLLIHVEGQTEETFVKTTLAPHLHGAGFTTVGARLLGNARNRSHRGGIKDWQVVKRDIERHLREDSGAHASIMVDYYAPPHSWPGRNQPAALPAAAKFSQINESILNDFEETTGIIGRFIPFVLMYEFEGLLFSDCEKFAKSIGYGSTYAELQNVRDQFDSPEHINDSPTTAPSKRVQNIISGYDKVLFGNVAASEIGLDRIREECPNFNIWVETLEGIAN